MTINRKINIAVTFSVTDTSAGNFGGGATYVQTSSIPNMGNIIDSNGQINLDHALPYDSAVYNQNVDLEFTLATPCIGAHSFNVAWATEHGPGMTIQAPTQGKNEQEQIRENNEMTVIFDSKRPNIITVEDKDDDSNVYNYKPALEIIRPGSSNYYISLDPRIVNRPRD